MSDRLTLRYFGPDVKSGRMDAYEAAASILGFADFLGAATRAIYGPQARLATEVNAFRRGSFAIDFSIQLGTIATLFGITGPKELLEAVKQAIDLWKFLRGQEPEQTIRIDDQSVKVINSSGDVTVIHAQTLN